MNYISLLLPLFIGQMLGAAQCTSRLFLLNKSLFETLIFGGLTGILYLMAIPLWIIVLKSTSSISGAYAFLVLGAFTAIFIMNLSGLPGTTRVSIQDVVGIILMVIGSSIMKR